MAVVVFHGKHITTFSFACQECNDGYMKVCKTCLENKSCEEFYLRTEKLPKIEYRTQCKKCFNIAKGERRRENNKKRDSMEYWECRVCKCVKLKTSFPRSFLKKGVNKNTCECCLTKKLDEQRKKNIKITSEWRGRNRDKRAMYYSINKESGKLREAARKRRKIPKYKISGAMSSRINECIRKGYRSWTTFVPYTLDELMEHLKSQLSDGMTMENHGSYWHIDHIRPICSFNFSSETDEDFKECWSLKNLRPLRVRDNLSKGGRWITPLE